MRSTRGIDHELGYVWHEFRQQGLGHEVEPCQPRGARGGCLRVAALPLMEVTAVVGRVARLPRGGGFDMVELKTLQGRADAQGLHSHGC